MDTPSSILGPDISLSEGDNHSCYTERPASGENTPENRLRVCPPLLSRKFREVMVLQRSRERNRINQRKVREKRKIYIEDLESQIDSLEASHRQLIGQISDLRTKLLLTQKMLEYWQRVARPWLMSMVEANVVGLDRIPVIARMPIIHVDLSFPFLFFSWL